MRATHPILLAASLAVLGSADAPAQESPRALAVDPLLLAQAAEVYAVIASESNPLWPGWNARDTPLLFYLPPEQEVLVNHPAPPEGFVPYRGPDLFDGRPVFVRDGATHFDLDGQNTSTEVAGVRTLVVADTLSNLRNDLRGRLDGSADLYTAIGELGSRDLAPDPYATMAMVAHEAFHVFQDLHAPEKLASEQWLLEYPVLSRDNNLGVALEAREAAAALRAEDPDELRAAALGWLAVREERRAQLGELAVAYEDGTEFGEGLATYVEWRFAEAFEGREPRPALWYARGFAGFEDLTFLRERMLERLVAFCSGDIAVNNDPHGTAPVRMRLYWSGMAAGALLDRLDPSWHARILEPHSTLTGLVRAALDPRPEELRAALERIRSDPEHDRLARVAQMREWKGRLAAQAQVDAILEGPGTLVTIDHSALGDRAAAFGYTPFGLTLLSPTRRIYKLVPISARFPDGSTLRQSRPAPLLVDEDEGTARFRLAEEVPLEELLSQLGAEKLEEAVLEELTLELPGATLELARVCLAFEGRELLIQLIPE